MNLASYVRDIPNFPQQGILFRDITPLLKDPTIFDYIINSFLDYYSTQSIDVVAGIESRGFLFATPLALKLEHQLPRRLVLHLGMGEVRQHLIR